MRDTKNKEHSLKGKISDTKRSRSMRHINFQAVGIRSTNSAVDSRPNFNPSQTFSFRLHDGKPPICSVICF